MRLIRQRLLRPIRASVAQNATGRPATSPGSNARPVIAPRSDSDAAQTAATHRAGNERSQAGLAVAEDASV